MVITLEDYQLITGLIFFTNLKMQLYIDSIVSPQEFRIFGDCDLKIS